MKPEDLTQVAELLADDSRTGKAKLAFRRRSVSTSYYAIFHALALLCADELLGPDPSGRDRVYRTLDHAAARNGLKIVANETSDPVLSRLSTLFRDLQNARHDADYKEDHVVSAREAKEWRDAAARAIFELSLLSHATRRTIAIELLFKSRSERR